jgi:hypothetical protein
LRNASGLQVRGQLEDSQGMSDTFNFPVSWGTMGNWLSRPVAFSDSERYCQPGK